MRYIEFRDSIRRALRQSSNGLTWSQLQRRLSLPYDRPCPEWTRLLEQEIGLSGIKGDGRALIWRLPLGAGKTR